MNHSKVLNKNRYQIFLKICELVLFSKHFSILQEENFELNYHILFLIDIYKAIPYIYLTYPLFNPAIDDHF